MRDKLKDMIISNINRWDEDDIYVISLFVYDMNDNPCRPTVTLGYNTESQVKKATLEASGEQEARWNFAFWLQNEFFCFGRDETEQEVINWLTDNRLPNYPDDDPAWDDDDAYDEVEIITEKFVGELICIVKEIHQTGLLTQKFGKEIPILIHELEYYDEIAEQNIEANGLEGLEDFAEFCEA